MIEEDGSVRSATPPPLTLLEGTPNCLTPEVKSTVDADTRLVCLLTLDIADLCPFLQRWAGDWQVSGCSVYNVAVGSKPTPSLT